MKLRTAAFVAQYTDPPGYGSRPADDEIVNKMVFELWQLNCAWIGIDMPAIEPMLIMSPAPPSGLFLKIGNTACVI